MKLTKKPDRIILEGKKGIHQIIPVSDKVFRCTYTENDTFVDPSVLISDTVFDSIPEFSVTEHEDRFLIFTSSLALSINKNTEFFTWTDRITETVLLKEGRKELSETDVIRFSTGEEAPVVRRVKTVDGERNFIENLKPVKDRFAYRAKLHLSFDPDEAIFGFGQGEDGLYDHRHQNLYLYQHNMRIPMPFFQSSRGYGILVDCCSLMTFNEDAAGCYLFLDTVKQLDYYFLAGSSADEIIYGCRRLTGTAAMLPKWAYGYIQSKERYQSDRELLDVVKHYRDLKVPLDCIVQDWYTWEEDHWGEKRLDKSRYPDLKACIDQIHAMHVHTMVSIWPNMNNGTVDHSEFLEKGLLLNDLCTYDAFSEEAREIYWRQAETELFRSGFDSWWCDSTEPFSGPDWNGAVKREPWERYVLVGNEHKHFLDPEYANIYALMHARGIYENQRRADQEKRVLNLTRSGYSSIQKYAAVLWSGDITATWQTLKNQIAEGLNMGLSGYPYWTLDIGGFFTVREKWQNRGCCCNQDPEMKWFWQGDFEEGIHDKGYQELYTRWFQFGAFLPMFRSHGTDTPREIWNFGKEGDLVYDILKKYILLRYRLMPYIYSLAGDVRLNHGTIMRSLLFDFPKDPEAVRQAQEYLFGPSILVCPVTEPMYYGPGNLPLKHARTWSCYLPDGCFWYDFWTGERYEGKQTVTVPAPLDRLPLFIKAGSILPAAEGLQYASQKPEHPLKLILYPGADASFTLYEDQGDTYEYEQGSFSLIPLTWCDASRTLTIGSRTGFFRGMEETREFEIHLASFENRLFTVTYDGTEKEIKVDL